MNPTIDNAHHATTGYSTGYIGVPAAPLDLEPAGDTLLLTVVSGRITVQTRAGELTLPEATFIVLNEGKAVRLRSAGRGSAEVFYVRLPGAYPLLNEGGDPVQDYPPFAYPLSEISLGNTLHLLIGGKSFTAVQIRNALLHTRAFTAQCIARLPVKNPSVALDIFWKLQQARLAILQCLDGTLPVAQMANEACMSEAYFSRTFRVLYGLSPLQCHLHAKIDRAADLLRRTDAPISGIVKALRFHNASTFIRRFKQLYRITPQQYRRYNHLEKSPAVAEELWS